VARRYEIMSIPTLVVFHDGVAKKRMIGAKGKGQLVQELAEFL
jgi:thioredoxin 1